VARLAPRQAWLVHLSHEMDNWLLDNGLPENVSVPFDGQQIAVGLRDAVTV
jgi:phosphoribosyl 1,2-cyclic phosphate phosphodiesterase